MRKRHELPQPVPGLEVIKKTLPNPQAPDVPSRRLMDWDAIRARGLFTPTQAQKEGFELEPDPAAQYQGFYGYRMLYRRRS